MSNITEDTKIAELLNSYDGMKDILISINPKFKKLNNPILRRTLAKVASVKQAAMIGGMDSIDLVNKLRVAVGQEPLVAKSNSIKEPKSNDIPEPNWTKDATLTLDANELLDAEKNPLAEVNKALKEHSVVALKSDFLPEPLIEEFKKSGKKVFVKEIDSENFITYISI
jgi:hypothetical protein